MYFEATVVFIEEIQMKNGVKEIKEYLEGSKSAKEVIDLINIRTRQYAKRQNTWSRGHMKTWKKLYSKDFPVLARKALKEIS